MAQNKTNQFEADILKLIFNATTIANIATNATTSPITSLFIALFTAAPDEQSAFTNEATYTGYGRIGVTRNGTEWVVTQSSTTAGGITGGSETTSGARVQNANAITFAQCTGGSNTITHMAICKTISGTTASDMLYAGALQSSLTVSSGVTPQFAANAITLYEY